MLVVYNQWVSLASSLLNLFFFFFFFFYGVTYHCTITDLLVSNLRLFFLSRAFPGKYKLRLVRDLSVPPSCSGAIDGISVLACQTSFRSAVSGSRRDCQGAPGDTCSRRLRGILSE